MAAGKRVILGEAREAPIETVSAADLQALLTHPTTRCHGVGRSDDIVVCVAASALEAMERAVGSVAPLQHAGVMLGEVEATSTSYLVKIACAIPFPHVESSADRVRVPRRAWQEILETHARSYRDLRIVGWYHSHSGLGATFSESDSFVQRFFFPAQWQVACVLDAERRERQFFQRRGRDVSPISGYYVAGQRPGVAPPVERPVAGAPAASGSGTVPAPSRVGSLATGMPAGRSSGTPVEGSSASSGARVMRSQSASTPASGFNKSGRRDELGDERDEAPRAGSDNYLRDRFIERSLEKIIRQLKEPPMRARDYLMLAFMVAIVLLVVLVRPGTHASPPMQDVVMRLDQINAHLSRLEGAQRGAVRPAAGRLSSTAPDGSSSALREPPAQGETDTQHPLAAGETLWSVCQTYYQDASLMDALMRYNRIDRAEDLKPGHLLKIPARRVLEALATSPAAREKSPATREKSPATPSPSN